MCQKKRTMRGGGDIVGQGQSARNVKGNEIKYETDILLIGTIDAIE